MQNCNDIHVVCSTYWIDLCPVPVFLVEFYLQDVAQNRCDFHASTRAHKLPCEFVNGAFLAHGGLIGAVLSVR